MTFDESFSRAYRTSVEAIPEPANLVAGILESAEAQGTPADTETSASTFATPFGSPRRSRRRTPSHHVRRKSPWVRPLLAGICATASLALVAALPAVAPTLESALNPAVSPRTANGPSAPTAAEDASAEAATQPERTPLVPGLSVKAYAIGGEASDIPSWAQGPDHSWGGPYIEGVEEPLALFYPGGASGTGEITMWPEEDGSVTQAYFIANTFTLEGSNIARIQIRTSEGELYLQSIDEDVHGDRTVDLWGLDPRERGTRVGYEDCDVISSYDWMEQDANGQWHSHQDAFRMKRMGAVIDLSKSDDERVGTRDIQFGLLSLATTSAKGKPAGWMSDPHFVETLAQPEHIFDGTQLTITATFDDGTCETQVIELHRDEVLADEDGIEPARPIQLYENVFDQENTTCTELAYGTLVSKTDEPFPYADEAANQYASTLMPPMPPESEPFSIN